MSLFSNALWLEYEECTGAVRSGLEKRRRRNAFRCWPRFRGGAVGQDLLRLARPTFAIPGDDHLVELAVAGGARAVITHNVRDLRRAELQWSGFMILTPSECLEKFP